MHWSFLFSILAIAYQGCCEVVITNKSAFSVASILEDNGQNLTKRFDGPTPPFDGGLNGRTIVILLLQMISDYCVEILWS